MIRMIRLKQNLTMRLQKLKRQQTPRQMLSQTHFVDTLGYSKLDCSCIQALPIWYSIELVYYHIRLLLPGQHYHIHLNVAIVCNEHQTEQINHIHDAAVDAAVVAVAAAVAAAVDIFLSYCCCYYCYYYCLLQT